jgi:hypothetical protein
MAATTACKKEGGAGGAGGGGGGGGGDDLNVVPADSDIVGAVDLASLRSSAAFKELGQKILAKATKDISKFKDKCGLDPVETMKSVSFGIKMLDGDKARGSVVVHTSVSKDQVKACLEKAKPEAEADGGKIVIEGDIAYITSKKNDGFVALTFLGGDGVVALINDSEWNAEKVAAALKGGGSIKGSKEFTDLHGALKKGNTMWFYINGASKIADQAKMIGLSAKAFVGSVTIKDGLTAEFRARMGTADEAKATADALKGQMEMAQMIFTKIDSRADGNDYRIDAELSAGQMKALAAKAGLGIDASGGNGNEPSAPPPVPAPEAQPAPAAPAQ